MDRLKEQGKEAKRLKGKFRKSISQGNSFRQVGAVHITNEDYGKTFDLVPYTNRYVKKVKEDLKREYRAVKRNEKHRLKKEIQQVIEDDE